jgi:hypothetical protein
MQQEFLEKKYCKIVKVLQYIFLKILVSDEIYGTEMSRVIL